MSDSVAQFFATHQQVLLDAVQYFVTDKETAIRLIQACQQSLSEQSAEAHHPLHNKVFFHLLKHVSPDFSGNFLANRVIALQHYKVLRETLPALPLRCQKVAVLLRLHGWQYSAISAELKISEECVRKCVKRILFCCADDLRLAVHTHQPLLNSQSLYAKQSIYAKPLKGRRRVAHHLALDWFATLATDQPSATEINEFNTWLLKSHKNVLAYAQIGEIWTDKSLDLMLKRAAYQFVLPRLPLPFLYKTQSLNR